MEKEEWSRSSSSGQRVMICEIKDEDGEERSCKRVKQQHQQFSTSTDAMEVEEEAITAAQKQLQQENDPDKILIEMVRSGDCSYDEIVRFCISSGIPLSRMLRLDLMRKGNSSCSTKSTLL